MTAVRTTSRTRVHVHGPLDAHAERFAAELRRLGFAPTSARGQLYLMAHLSRWFDDQGLGVGDLTVELVEAFLGERRRAYSALYTRRALQPLLDWLAASGAIRVEATSPPEQPEDPVVLVRYEKYLQLERRLQPRTTAAHVDRVRRFLDGFTPPEGLEALSAADVTRALLDEGQQRAPVSVKKFGYVLKAFLRFCLLTGEIDHDLTGALMVIRSPQPPLLPVGVGEDQIQALLAACDRTTVAGRRDYAVIVLLTELGLRAGEVSGLCLDDFDWHHGEILIRGKGARDERLPLPTESGAAVADYLMHARPEEPGYREVFCSVRAPRGPLGQAAVWAIVQRGCERAGLRPFGPHQLRHTLGEAMVAAEVPLAAIGQVLRHEDPMTTANYARVDVPRLRTLAQPWPAGGVQ